MEELCHQCFRQWLLSSVALKLSVNQWRLSWKSYNYIRYQFCQNQDFMIWWRHQMETCSALLALCAGNSPVTSEFPAQSQCRGASIFSLICAWIYGCVNGEAGDLRRHRAHYDVTVLYSCDSMNTSDRNSMNRAIEIGARCSYIVTLKQNTILIFFLNVFEHGICEITAILFRPRCVQLYHFRTENDVSNPSRAEMFYDDIDLFVDNDKTWRRYS